MTKALILFFVLWQTNLALAQTINPNITNDTPDNRYIVHEDGTVTDKGTDLMWKQCSEGQSGGDCATDKATIHTWQSALQLAEADTTAGYSDWRLPNIKELRSLVAYDRHSPSINITVFPNTLPDRYWSSSPTDSSMWTMIFISGHEESFYPSDYAKVRLVRDDAAQ